MLLYEKWKKNFLFVHSTNYDVMVMPMMVMAFGQNSNKYSSTLLTTRHHHVLPGKT